MRTATAQLYETDFYGWIQHQVGAMRAGNLSNLDLDNLIEEVEDMGKRQKQELRSRLTILLMHLLKWQYQPALQSRSWVSTIKIQRFEIKSHMEENPSLTHVLDGIMAKAWQGYPLFRRSAHGRLSRCWTTIFGLPPERDWGISAQRFRLANAAAIAP